MFFGEALEIARREMGLNISDFMRLWNSTAARYRNYQVSGVNARSPEHEFLTAVQQDLLLNMHWMYFGTGPRWSPEAEAMRADMLHMAETLPIKMTPAQRLVATWAKPREHFPEFREDVWSTYLRWMFISDKMTLATIRFPEWLACKQGDIQPGYEQFKGASILTGLPVKWFECGLLDIEEKAASSLQS